MPEPTGSEARLQSLRRRWETEKSTAFLPLAEEYRRLGRLREAIDVLETGLKGNPTYTSGLVALGRCRLESGDPAGAAGVLERVVAQDPEQMVASKLLIEAYLRTGRAKEARRRLDIYSTLNAKDPEIARLSDRLQALATPAPAPAPSAPSLVAAAAAEAPPEPSASEIEVLPVPGRETAEKPEVPAAPPTLPAAALPLAGGLVFRGLDGPVAVSRYVRGLVSEGLFRLMFPTAAELAITPSPLFAPAPEREPELVVDEPEPVVEGRQLGVEATEPASAALAGDSVTSGAEVAVEPGATAPAVETAGFAEPVLEPFEADVERAISGFVPLKAPEPMVESMPAETAASELAVRPSIETPPAAAPDTAPPVVETTTLGGLYLQQGHAADAERIFGAVLGREPQNNEARRGLGEAREQLRQTGGLSARRASALRDYLRRLTRREERHVP